MPDRAQPYSDRTDSGPRRLICGHWPEIRDWTWERRRTKVEHTDLWTRENFFLYVPLTGNITKHCTDKFALFLSSFVYPSFSANKTNSDWWKSLGLHISNVWGDRPTDRQTNHQTDRSLDIPTDTAKYRDVRTLLVLKEKEVTLQSCVVGRDSKPPKRQTDKKIDR